MSRCRTGEGCVINFVRPFFNSHTQTHTHTLEVHTYIYIYLFADGKDKNHLEHIHTIRSKQSSTYIYIRKHIPYIVIGVGGKKYYRTDKNYYHHRSSVYIIYRRGRRGSRSWKRRRKGNGGGGGWGRKRPTFVVYRVRMSVVVEVVLVNEWAREGRGVSENSNPFWADLPSGRPNGEC